MPDLFETAMTEPQRRVFEAIRSGPRGGVEGPLRVWLHSAGLAEKAQELGAFCRYGTSLPAALSELAIITTGAHWKAGFEWHVHAPIAAERGIPLEAIAAIRRSERPELPNAAQAAVYGFASELLRDRRVSDATYEFARSQLGDVGLVDLVGILGYYALISMTIVAFEVPVPGQEHDPFIKG